MIPQRHKISTEVVCDIVRANERSWWVKAADSGRGWTRLLERESRLMGGEGERAFHWAGTGSTVQGQWNWQGDVMPTWGVYTGVIFCHLVISCHFRTSFFAFTWPTSQSLGGETMTEFNKLSRVLIEARVVTSSSLNLPIPCLYFCCLLAKLFSLI